MSYRVETAASGRAVCRATECKDAGVKIEKDELRLGIWVEFQGQGSWTWRHWGCMSGYQLQNIRKMLVDPDDPDVYRWDYLDGYSGEEKNSLDKHPDLQEKVRRVIAQGFIDPEDFNGDPEMNKLGEKGLRNKETKLKMMAEKRQGKHEIAELTEQVEALKAQLAEREGRSGSITQLQDDIARAEEEIELKKSPAKKKASKNRVMNQESEEEHSEEAKPAKRKRASKAKKEEFASEDEDVKPAKKKRVPKVKKQEEDDSEEKKPKPAKKSRAKKAAKQEYDDEDEDQSGDEVMPAPSKRAASKRGVKKEEALGPVKKEEPTDDPVKKEEPTEERVKKEENDADISMNDVPKKSARGKKAVKKEEVDDDEAPLVEKKPPAKKGRKKAVKKEEPTDEPELDSDTQPAVKGEPEAPSASFDSKTNLEHEQLKDEEPQEDLKDEDLETEAKKGKKGKKTSTAPKRASRSRAASKK